jgi:hypothetical protein
MMVPTRHPVTVLLRGVNTPLDSETGREFITDCARFTEGLLSEGEVLSKWGLGGADWETLSKNSALLDAVQRERANRVSNGRAATDAARKYFSEAPHILARILRDDASQPRHRIEAARELRATATLEDKLHGQSGENFTVVINLGNEKHTYELESIRGDETDIAAAEIVDE